jgi:hypothetical protein
MLGLGRIDTYRCWSLNRDPAPHLLLPKVDPRRPPVQVSASGVVPLAASPSPLRQSHYPGPQAVGWRLCVLPFRWSLPLSVAWKSLVSVSASSFDTLKIVMIEWKVPAPGHQISRLSWFFRALISVKGYNGWAEGKTGLRGESISETQRKRPLPEKFMLTCRRREDSASRTETLRDFLRHGGPRHHFWTRVARVAG